MKGTTWLSAAIAVVAFDGCTLLESTHVPPTAQEARTTGSYYFLPTAQMRVTFLRQNSQLVFDPANDLRIVPDRAALFTLDYDASFLSDDVITVQVDSNGLLEKIESKATDKTGEIIVKLVETAKEVIKAGAFPAGMIAPEKAEFVFDPENVDELNQNLRAVAADAPQLRIDPPVRRTEVPSSCGEGVCFRPLLPYTVTVLSGGVPIATHPVMIPNGAPTLVLPIRRASFVSKVTNVTFVGGIPKEVHLEKPSEGVAFAEIPLTVAKAITSIPAELLQLKIDYSSKAAELAGAQKNMLEAGKALAEANAETKKKPGDGQGPNPQ